MSEVLGQMTSSTDTRCAAKDSKAFLDYFASRDFRPACPSRIVAPATFQTGAPLHRRRAEPEQRPAAPRDPGLVAGANHHTGYPPELAEELDQQLTEARVDHTMEVYPEALHGWTQTDFPVYEAAPERRRTELFCLFDEALKPTEA